MNPEKISIEPHQKLPKASDRWSLAPGPHTMSLCPSKRARGVILDDDDTDDAVAFEPGVNIAALVFSKIQCVRTRAALAQASKFWLDVSKQKEALPRRLYLPVCANVFNHSYTYNYGKCLRCDGTGRIICDGGIFAYKYEPKLLKLLDNDEALSLPKERVLELMHRVKTGRSLCFFAAEHGCLKVLQWALANGSLILTTGRDRNSYFAASVSGHLHVVKWLHENGYRWDYRAFGHASIAAPDTSTTPAHIPITQYLVDNKCPGWEDMRVKWAKFLT